jgi:flagellar motor switch protein FliN/FliY
VSQVESVDVEISVVLGRAALPVRELLRLGRGAVIPFSARPSDEVWVLANDHPIARGEIRVVGDRVSVALTRAASAAEFAAARC